MVASFPTSDRSRSRYTRNNRDEYNYSNGFYPDRSQSSSSNGRKRFNRYESNQSIRSMSGTYFQPDEDYDNNGSEDDDSFTNSRYADEERIEEDEEADQEDGDAQGEEDLDEDLNELLMSEELSKWIWDNSYPGNGEATTEAKISSILKKSKDDLLRNRGESPSNENPYLSPSSSSGKRPQDNGWDESRRSTGGKRARLEMERRGLTSLTNRSYSNMGSSSYSGYSSSAPSSSYLNPRFDLSTSATSSNDDESEKLRKELDELKSSKFALEQRNFKLQTDFNNLNITCKLLKEQNPSTSSVSSTNSSDGPIPSILSSMLRIQFLNPANTDEDLDSIWSPTTNSNASADLLVFNEYAKEIGLGGPCEGRVYQIEKAVLKGMVHLLVAYASERIEKKGTAAPYSTTLSSSETTNYNASMTVPSSSKSNLGVPVTPSTTAPTLATTFVPSSTLAPIPYVSPNPFQMNSSNSIISTSPAIRLARSTDRDQERNKLGGLLTSNYTNSSLNRIPESITSTSTATNNHCSSPLATSEVINAQNIGCSYPDHSRSKYFMASGPSPQMPYNFETSRQPLPYPPVLIPATSSSSSSSALANNYFSNSHSSTRIVPSTFHSPANYPATIPMDCPESAAAYALSSISQTPIHSTATNSSNSNSSGTIVNGQNVRGTPTVDQQVVLLTNASNIRAEREKKEVEDAIAQVAEFEKAEREALRKKNLDEGFSNGNTSMFTEGEMEENEEKRVDRVIQEQMMRNQDIEMDEDEARMREEYEDAESERELAGTDWNGDEGASSSVW